MEELNVQTSGETSRWIGPMKEKVYRNINDKLPCQLSPCSRFVFTTGKYYLDIVDTVCGFNIQIPIDERYRSLYSRPIVFYPTDFDRGVLFWFGYTLNQIENKEALATLPGDRRYYAARLQINYQTKTMHMDGKEVCLRGYCNPLQVLEQGRTALIYISGQIEHPGPVASNTCTFRQFNLDTMEYFGPTIVCPGGVKDVFCLCRNIITWYRNQVYHFISELWFDRIHVYSNCEGRNEIIQLENDLRCVFNETSDDIVCVWGGSKFTTTWRENLFFLHLSVKQKGTCVFKQYFAVLDLDTRCWQPATFNNLPQQVKFPMNMCVGEDTIVFLQSTGDKYFFEVSCRAEHTTFPDVISYGFIMPPHLIRDPTLHKHSHFVAYRVPLKRPEALVVLSLAVTNRKYPNLKRKHIFPQSLQLLWPVKKKYHRLCYPENVATRFRSDCPECFTLLPQILLFTLIVNVDSLNECYFCGKRGVSCDSPIIQECPYPNSGCYKGTDNYGILTVAGCGPKDTLVATGYKINGCLSDDIGTMCTCFTSDMCNK